MRNLLLRRFFIGVPLTLAVAVLMCAIYALVFAVFFAGEHVSVYDSGSHDEMLLQSVEHLQEDLHEMRVTHRRMMLFVAILGIILLPINIASLTRRFMDR